MSIATINGRGRNSILKIDPRVPLRFLLRNAILEEEATREEVAHGVGNEANKSKGASICRMTAWYLIFAAGRPLMDELVYVSANKSRTRRLDFFFCSGTTRLTESKDQTSLITSAMKNKMMLVKAFFN